MLGVLLRYISISSRPPARQRKDDYLSHKVKPPAKTVCFIHTAEVEIREEETGTALFESVTDNSYYGITRGSISGQRKSERRRRWHYNPNSFAENMSLPYDKNNYYGHCQSAETFEKGLTLWVGNNVPLNREQVHVVRLDCAIDEQHPEDERRLCRAYEAIVHNFACSYKVVKRDQYRTETLLTRERKSMAATKGGISMELYNRRMKHPQSPVEWRFEIRYGEAVHNRPKNSLSPEDMLAHLKMVLCDSRMQDLQCLENEMNRQLLKVYRKNATQQEVAATLPAMYEFVRLNADRIFTCRQLAALLKLLNPALSDDDAKKKARRQLERHRSAYNIINERDYHAILQRCIDGIEEHITSYRQYRAHSHTPFRGVYSAEAVQEKPMESLDYKENRNSKIDSTYIARFASPQTPTKEDEYNYSLEDISFFQQTEEQEPYTEEEIDAFIAASHKRDDNFPPWPPVGQPSLAIGRTPPPWVKEGNHAGLV